MSAVDIKSTPTSADAQAGKEVIQAAIANDLPRLQLALKSGASTAAIDVALGQALRQGWLPGAEALRDANKAPRDAATLRLMVQRAAISGKMPVVEFAMRLADFDTSDSALILAARNGHAGLMKDLWSGKEYQKSREVPVEDLCRIAVAEGKLEALIAAVISQHYDQKTSLARWAAAKPLLSAELGAKLADAVEGKCKFERREMLTRNLWSAMYWAVALGDTQAASFVQNLDRKREFNTPDIVQGAALKAYSAADKEIATAMAPWMKKNIWGFGCTRVSWR